MHKKALAIIKASKASYDFIEVCWKKGLCTFEEANTAMIKVHDQTMRDIDEVYISKEQFIKDQMLNAGGFI